MVVVEVLRVRSRVDCTCRSPTFSKMKAAPWKEFKIKMYFCGIMWQC